MFRKRVSFPKSRYSKRARTSKYKRTRPKYRIQSRYALTNIVDQVVKRTTELKYHQLNQSHTFTVGGSFNVMRLTNVVQGTVDTARVGDRLMGSTLEFNYHLVDFSTSITADRINAVRTIIFTWYANLLGVNPGVTDILFSQDTKSAYNHDKRQMFKIHYDKCLPVIATNDNAYRVQKVFIKIPKKMNQFQFTAASVNSTNAIYMISFAATQSASTTVNQYTDSTFRFYDA